MSYFNTPNMEIDTGRGILDVFTDLAETIDQLEELREKKNQTTNSLGVTIKHADVESAQVSKRRRGFC